jgi:hypothetical protein
VTVLVHRNRGTKIDFERVLADKCIRLVGFTSLMLIALLSACDLQLKAREMTAPGLTGAEEEVDSNTRGRGLLI